MMFNKKLKAQVKELNSQLRNSYSKESLVEAMNTLEKCVENEKSLEAEIKSHLQSEGKLKNENTRLMRELHELKNSLEPKTEYKITLNDGTCKNIEAHAYDSGVFAIYSERGLYPIAEYNTEQIQSVVVV